MSKILIVEDDVDVRGMVVDWLKHESHLVEAAGTVSDAKGFLSTYEFDLIILDIELPDGSGFDICKSFRARGGTTPILMLTGRDAVADKETGLDAGADDYLTKPFHMRELSARVRALFRRPQSYNDSALERGPIRLDPRTFEVTISGASVKLLPREFALLEFFMRHPNQVFSAESLLDRVWSSDKDAGTETVRQCVKRLRRKIDKDECGSLIQNIHGVGYKLQV